ncbi:DUF1428 family protein [Halobacillus sp. A5]|uniref:DUF1428 family protein n=1 Tax=Halobacillus sp. A5 TaxID=2880263 RepID=UPI0020A63E0E|nr:DUF1428 family protein [Halobacillus sp. A5]MCP3029080.1 DUF1428 family protein [Halobacillus sp. A5]
MFVSLYIFRVHRQSVPRFIELIDQLKPLIQSYEGKAYLFEEDVLTGKQGSMGLLNLFDLRDEEVVFLGKIEFHSKEHFHEAMEQMKQDNLIKQTYDQLREVVDFTSLITSTFHDAESEV